MGQLAYNDLWLADPEGSGFPANPASGSRLIDLNLLERDKTATGWLAIDGPALIDDNLVSVDLGSFGTEGDLRAASRFGGGVVTLTLGYQVAEGGSLTDLLADLEALQEALAAGGVLAWQVRGRDEPVFWDFDPSQVPQMLVGQSGALHKIAETLADPDGVGVEISVAHPWPRLAPVTLATVQTTNEVGGREILIDNPGNRPSEARIVLDPTAGELAGWRYCVKSEGNLTEFRTLYSAAASGATMGADTSSAAATGASGGNAAVTTFATQAGMAKRFRDTRTPTDPDALAGIYRAYARMKPQGGTTADREYRLVLYYGFDTADLAQKRANPERIEVDFGDVPTPDWVEIYLGTIVVPEGVPRLQLDFWAKQVDGDWNLAVDQIVLEPATELHTHVTVPGFRMGAWARRRFPADELDGTGVLKRGTYRLNATGEIARPDPAAGFVLAAGIYEARAFCFLRDETGARRKLGELQVIRNPTGTPTTKASKRMRTRKNRVWTFRRRRARFEVTAAEAGAGDTFLPRVQFTDTATTGRRIQVRAIQLRFVRALTTSTPAAIDGRRWERRATAEDGSGGAIFPLVHENDLPVLAPGDSLLLLAAIDLPKAEGYEEIDEREPLGISVLTRATDIAVQITPRVSH